MLQVDFNWETYVLSVENGLTRWNSALYSDSRRHGYTMPLFRTRFLYSLVFFLNVFFDGGLELNDQGVCKR